MTIEKKLYTAKEVELLIKEAVHDIAIKLGDLSVSSSQAQITIMRQWASELLPEVEDAVVEQVVRRHVQGVTLAVWEGPSGCGKSTNIEAVNFLGKVYAEVTSQGVARVLDEPYHSMLLRFSMAQSTINTGTKGMFNRPEGEYAEIFSELVPVIGKIIADGGYAPDNMVSVLVELMILYRLTQNSHNIQIDLWPRTGPQFEAFRALTQKVEDAGGKIMKEVVIIKVLNPSSLKMTRENMLPCAAESRKIAESVIKCMKSEWFIEAHAISEKMTDFRARFTEEEKTLSKVFALLEQEYPDEIGKTVIEELKKVCERLKFRFELTLSKGLTPRQDEHPLSFIRKMSIYMGETSPTFLEAANVGNKGYHIVSSAGTPEEVVAGILDTLSGNPSTENRWQQIKDLAGIIAKKIVFREELIVDEHLQRVGGILNS